MDSNDQKENTHKPMQKKKNLKSKNRKQNKKQKILKEKQALPRPPLFSQNKEKCIQ